MEQDRGKVNWAEKEQEYVRARARVRAGAEAATGGSVIKSVSVRIHGLLPALCPDFDLGSGPQIHKYTH